MGNVNNFNVLRSISLTQDGDGEVITGEGRRPDEGQFCGSSNTGRESSLFFFIYLFINVFILRSILRLFSAVVMVVIP
jgi:hypothetical protein